MQVTLMVKIKYDFCLECRLVWICNPDQRACRFEIYEYNLSFIIFAPITRFLFMSIPVKNEKEFC